MKFLNKTIIPLGLVEYETIYSHLGATRLVGYQFTICARLLEGELNKFNPGLGETLNIISSSRNASGLYQIISKEHIK